jgi:hypothetical protein
MVTNVQGPNGSSPLPTKSRSRTKWTLFTIVLVVTAVPRPACAQTASAAPASGDAPGDPDRFCREHWFAVSGCLERPWTGPRWMAGVDFGVSKMNESGPLGFNNGVGSVTGAGPGWGLRVGVELLPWLALEGRYAGMYDSAASSVSSSGGFLTSGVTGVVRLTAPLPLVHPYVFGGIGYYDVAFTGSSGSPMHSSSQAGVPLGVGVDVPLTYHLSAGIEAIYDFQIGEDFSAVTTNKIDGGDLTTFAAVLRARL